MSRARALSKWRHSDVESGRLPPLISSWRWFPNATSIRRKLQTTGMNVTLGDFAFASLGLAMALAILFYLVLDVPPAIVLIGSLLIGFGLPNIAIGRIAKKRGQRFNLLFPEAVDLIVRALRAGLPVQEAIANVSRDIKDPVGAVFRNAQHEMQLGVPIETALWRVAKTVQTEDSLLIVAMSISAHPGKSRGH